MYSKALVNPCFAMLFRPLGDLSRVWLCYVDSLVTLAVFGCYVSPLVTFVVFGYAM